MKAKLQRTFGRMLLCSLWLACAPYLQAEPPAAPPSVAAALDGIPYANSKAVAGLSSDDQQKYTAAAIQLWTAYKDVESSLKSQDENAAQQTDDAYITFASAMQQLNQRFGVSTAIEAQSSKKSSGVVLLAKSKNNSKGSNTQPNPAATSTAISSPAEPTCGGKKAPTSKDPNVIETYTCVCGEWKLESRTRMGNFAEPCGRQTISEERSTWVALSIKNSQGTFCRAAESSYSNTSYKPSVKPQQSCSNRNGTPQVVPATCVVNSESTTTTNDYTKCPNGSGRSHSDKRTKITTKRTAVLMCALGSWDYKVSTPESWSCLWDCNGNQKDPRCPKSEPEFYN